MLKCLCFMLFTPVNGSLRDAFGMCLGSHYVKPMISYKLAGTAYQFSWGQNRQEEVSKKARNCKSY